jgi:hypothetical protein
VLDKAYVGYGLEGSSGSEYRCKGQ